MSGLTRDQASKFRERYFKLPSDHKNHWIDPRSKHERTFDELLAHVAAGKGNTRLNFVGSKAWNKQCGNLSAYIIWLKANCDDAKGMEDIFAGLLKPVKKATVARRLERAMTSTVSLNALFKTPIWVGRRSRYHLTAPGCLVIRDSLYWVPLMEVCLGVRREEACQLRVRHLTMKFGHLGIDLLADDLRIKGGDGASRRWIPLSKGLLELGFAECLIAGRNPNDLLFEELTNNNVHSAYGVAFGKRLGNYVKTVVPDFSGAATEALAGMDLPDGRRAIMIAQEEARLLTEFRKKVKSHSFRHWFKTLAENSGCKTVFVEELMGHSSAARQSEGGRYMKEVSIQNLKETVDMIPLPFDAKELRRLAEKSEELQKTIL